MPTTGGALEVLSWQLWKLAPDPSSSRLLRPQSEWETSAQGRLKVQNELL